MSYIDRGTMRLMAGFLIVMMAHTAPVLAAATSLSEANSNASTVTAGAPPAKGRLRFKSAGPVCMCGDGMSERDIEAAMVRQGLAKPQAGGESVAGEGRAGKATGGRAPMENQNQGGGVAR